jgi:type IV secretion system protein VirD4
MSPRAKAVTAIVSFVLALCAGLYLSGFALILLLGLGGQVSVDWSTYWQYWQAQSLPGFVHYAGRIKAAGAVGFGLPLLLWLGLLYLLTREKAQSLHGNARFATAGDLKKAGLLSPAPNGIVVGKWGGQLIRLPGQQFVILAAPTRSGKGVGIVIPNLLEYQESVVVLDIKQENFDLTSGWRKSQGQEIYLFNPFAEDRRTHRWNPLSYVASDPAFRISDIQAIAAMLYPDVDERQKFWVSQARNAFAAFALYLFEQQDNAFCKQPPTLGQVFRLATGQDGDFRKYLENLAGKSFLSGGARAAFANLLSQQKETFASIMGTLMEPLNAWLNPVLEAATGADDFDLADVRKKKMTIYIGIQPNKLAESRLIVNLFFSQLINVNTRELPQNNKQLKYQCLLLMDEFTSIGAVDILAKAVAYMAGYNLRLLPIIQSMAQLDSVYGKEQARTLITNHALQILYAPREQQDANDYSDMLGYTTVRRESRTRGREVSRSESEERRALMLPQELKALGTDKEVFLYEGIAHPVKCDKIRYYQDKHFTKRVMPKVDIAQLRLGGTPSGGGEGPNSPDNRSNRSARAPAAKPRGNEGASAPDDDPPRPAPSPSPPAPPQAQRPTQPSTQRRAMQPALRAPGQSRAPAPGPQAPRWHRWRLPTPPENAPPPDYGQFWQRHPLPPENLLALNEPETPIEAIHGPRVRAIMGRLAVDEIIPQEGARLSSLIPVHRARYDHAYERGLLRMLQLANEQDAKKFGPRPPPRPPQPRRKPDLSRYGQPLLEDVPAQPVTERALCHGGRP